MRFTPAVKYGGRENQPSRRATRCIRYHPCRAHHKLKWARTEQSDIVLLYKQVPRSESIKATSTQNRAVHPNSARSTLFDRGWQQPLNHQTAQPTRRVKDAEGTAQPLVLDSVRWLGYLPCRAHHKLKWARKGQSVLVLLYSHLPRSESSKTIIAAKFRCPLTLRRLPKLQRVNPV